MRKPYLYFILLTLIFSNSCKSTKPVITEGGSEQFFMYKWVLAKLGDANVPTATGSREAHLLFYPGTMNRIAGSSGCNRIAGTMELNGTNGIRFSQVATTKMMCPDGAEIETKFLDVLLKTNAYHFRDGKLLLLADKSELATLQSLTVAPN